MIPQIAAGELKGKKKFDIQRKLELAFGPQNQDFGALFEVPTQVGEKTFPLRGWLGSEGKTELVVAEYTEAPAKSAKNADKEQPSLRLFLAVDGALMEIAVAFRHETKETKKVFLSGKTTTSPAMNLTFWPYSPKAAAKE